jgi:hypothetical protein
MSDTPAVPKFSDTIVPSDPPHACLGLNTCKGQDRFGTNECAGQGFCSTTADHTCHVKNECRDQGGCGLYGTAEEQEHPAQNDCKSFGSCATPINAERFSTNGRNQGRSVWALARARFEQRWREGLREQVQAKNPATPEKLHPAPAPFTETGPTYAWMSASACMTACGASGMSGAGRCS